MNRRNAPANVLITGATGGIGSALALAYAADGTTLHLLGRNEAALDRIATACRARGSLVPTYPLDLRDRTALAETMAHICRDSALDLVIVNAGVNTDIGPHGAGEAWEAVEELLEVNVTAVMATVHAVLPAMRSRQRGQIALISSLAAFYGLPITPSYSASKAAIRAYGEALRGWLQPEGIRVNVVMPGYVESSMCRAMPGPKPFLWPAERAARKIRKGLAADRPRITFPFPLDLGCWLLSVLPPAVSGRVLRFLNYGG